MLLSRTATALGLVMLCELVAMAVAPCANMCEKRLREMLVHQRINTNALSYCLLLLVFAMLGRYNTPVSIACYR